MTNQPLIPTQSSISPSIWLIAIVFAILTHLIFFLNHATPPVAEGAKNEGKKGIEIGLKKILPPPSPPKYKSVAKPPVQPKPIVKKKPKPIIKPKPIVIPEKVVEEKPLETEDTPVNETSAEMAVAQKANDFMPTVSPSFGGGNSKLKAAYETSLVAWLERYKRYPSAAKRRGQEGIIELEFTIDKQGNVLSQKIINASAYKSLNKAVTKMITKASPLPSVPKEIQYGKSTFTFVVPVTFELN